MAGMHPKRDLAALLDTLDPAADVVERHLWLIDLTDWLRGDASSVNATVSRLTLFVDALQQRPSARSQLQTWWHTLLNTVDATALLADFGFASGSAFISELFERIYLKLMPGTPETADAAMLFSLALGHRFDAQWIAALEPSLLARLADLLQTPPASLPIAALPPDGLTHWQCTLMGAITFCTGQIRATGFSPELRQRMNAPARWDSPFHALGKDLEAVFATLRASPVASTSARTQALEHFLSRLDDCRHAAASVYTHLDAHGISVNLVFELRQLRARVQRIHALLDCLLSDQSHSRSAALLAHLVNVGQDRLSLRALIMANSSMLAAKVAERSSETGEHYITRNRAEYRTMLRQAAGGGAVMSITTLMKFVILSVGMSAFWGGFFAGMNYALSFVLVQLLHWTVATKQPAMTAPAMAAKLKELGNPKAIEGFIDEVTHLVRSQVAAVVGNLALVIPCVLLISVAMQMGLGQPMIGEATARHVLQDLTLLGPTALFAAGTGVLLFASSIIAGWVENWFVLHRLDSALRYNPKINRTLGVARADRWAHFMRNNISGLAANLSLGLMLGLVPAFALFFGLGLEVRHVTLSTGQLAAAAASLGISIFHLGAFWWCVAGLAVTGVLNVGVSFYLAFQLALRAHNVVGVDRDHIYAALRHRLRTDLRSFFWPRTEPVNG
ncbi:MAG: site-specific recombinase [Rhodoferax sp.]|jgi:site-specific recombinase|uniref:site-specific recombinase n=1 Tax=Rhodoferax sp. TaxID=50421 RepID=UPI001B47ED8E|nr:site-specific recombinase [Rhodoferax sp.]MBP8288056.1 site-specific recombinase [Rhodoferax sp.]MBP9147404.1 site-specific recombinase [Rhodoferax sp.]MBP9735050.1 site-specific recombinase [Rhodoferax sp.]